MLKESSVHVHADVSQRVIYAKKRARACGQVCIAHMHACKLHRWINGQTCFFKTTGNML